MLSGITNAPFKSKIGSYNIPQRGNRITPPKPLEMLKSELELPQAINQRLTYEVIVFYLVL